MKKEPKFKMTFTLKQLSHIHNLLTISDSLITDMETQVELRLKTRLLLFKANEGITQPAYIPVQKLSTEEAIGMTADERRYFYYTKYCENPDSCNAEEVEYAKTYMYDNELMSAEEEAAYERDI